MHVEWTWCMCGLCILFLCLSVVYVFLGFLFVKDVGFVHVSDGVEVGTRVKGT